MYVENKNIMIMVEKNARDLFKVVVIGKDFK